MRVFAALLLLTSSLFAASPATTASPRWKLQYFYDRDETSFTIRDLAFSSPERGIAVGVVIENKKRPHPHGLSLITRDGGAHWIEVPLQEYPVSLFLLSDNVGWMVTTKGLWRTDEAGRSWKKVKGMDGLHRVHFRDEMRGWVTGEKKLFKETSDGGKTWTDVAAAKDVATDAENTYFDWIEWVSPKQAIVLGGHVAPRRDYFSDANWTDPERLSRRREWPGLNITLETKDGGETWQPQTVPTFGRFARFRSGKVLGSALSLVRFTNYFQYGSEVYLIDNKGKSGRVFRDARRNVTDVIWHGDSAYLVAVEPPGKMYQLPVPGKIHVLTSPDAKTWSEMKVDYRAFGMNATFAHAGEHIWVATDSGQILKLM